MKKTPAKALIYNHFLENIRGRRIAAGQRLPTELEIASKFDVSRSTVQLVMARLANEGVVRRVAGSGTFAQKIENDLKVRVDLDIHNIQSFENEVAIIGDRVTYKLLSYAKVAAPTRPAAKLGIATSDEVFQLYRLRFIDDVCIGSEMRYFSPMIRLNVSTQSLEDQGVHSMIEDGLKIKIGRIEAALRAAIASKSEAIDMGIEEGAPLLVRAHTLFTEADKVILYGESRYVEPFSFSYTANVRA